MKLGNTLYCSKCQEMFNREDGYKADISLVGVVFLAFYGAVKLIEIIF